MDSTLHYPRALFIWRSRLQVLIYPQVSALYLTNLIKLLSILTISLGCVACTIITIYIASHYKTKFPNHKASTFLYLSSAPSSWAMYGRIFYVCAGELKICSLKLQSTRKMFRLATKRNAIERLLPLPQLQETTTFTLNKTHTHKPC